MTAPKRPRVVVEINSCCDHQSGGETEKAYVDRDQWEAMTPAERCELLDGYADEVANNRFSWGWHIDDKADLAATE